MKKTQILILLILNFTVSFGQNKTLYNLAYNEIYKMLTGEIKPNFKRAVFLTENAFYKDSLDYTEFCKQIDEIEVQLYTFMKDKNVINHPMGKQFAIFSYMMVESKYNNNIKFSYDFEDITGLKDFSKMFVTKLLKTKTGQCHSLPFLYKILSEELGAEAYLALGPNHLYIKHKDDKGMWVNIELTNGSFPRDAWIMSSLSITTESIKNEIYMEPLTLKQSITLCLNDLALAYESQFGNDNFVIQCVNTSINFFPKSINAYMYKAEILSKQRALLLNTKGMQKKIKDLEKQITVIYHKIDAWGYKQMPKEQYERWIKAVEKEKKKLTK